MSVMRKRKVLRLCLWRFCFHNTSVEAWRGGNSFKLCPINREVMVRTSQRKRDPLKGGVGYLYKRCPRMAVWLMSGMQPGRNGATRLMWNLVTRRALTRWQVPGMTKGDYRRPWSSHGKILLSERSGNGSHLNLGHMNFVRH